MNRSAARLHYMWLRRSAWLVFVAGCSRTEPDVVVYCSVDETFARSIISEFEAGSDIEVGLLTDSEAGKTTGLLTRIRAEKNAPRADVLFSGEIFGTIQLANEGLLAPYESPEAADIPSQFRDAKNRWTAIGLRGRVLVFDPRRGSADAFPKRWEDLAEAPWVSRGAIANPLFGTTRGHVAAMYSHWGTERAEAFLRKLRAGGCLITDGNSSAVRAVMDGRADWCATDTDDVWVAQKDGASIDLIYPDMGHGDTLWIPSTVALIANGRQPANARRLADFLISAEVERILAESESRNVPVRPELRRLMNIDHHFTSNIDYADIAAHLDESDRAVREILLR